MSEVLTVLASGLVVASLYALFGSGVVLIYRTSGLLSFAHGAIASVAAYVMISLLAARVPYYTACVLAVLSTAALGATIYLAVVRWFSASSPEAAAIATLGLTLVIEGVLLYIYGGDYRALRQPVGSSTLFTIGEFHVQAWNVVDVGTAVVSFAALYLFLFRSRLGLAARAIGEGRITSSWSGINVVRVQTVIWAMSGALGGLAGITISALNSVTPTFMTEYLVTTFVALVLGGFERLVGVAIGAVLYGLLESIFSTYVTNKLTSTISFCLILLVLIVRPYGLFGRMLPTITEPKLPRESVAVRMRRVLSTSRGGGLIGHVRIRREGFRSPPSGLSAWVWLILIGVSAIVVGQAILSPSLLSLGAGVGATYIAVLGLDLIYGLSGQLAIGQSGFMLLGGYATAILQRRAGVPYGFAVTGAVVLAAIVGVAFALPATRLRGLYLALVSLAFALMVPELAIYFTSWTGGDSGIPVALPKAFAIGPDRVRQVYIYIGIVAVAASMATLALTRSRWGLVWRALRSSGPAAAASGISVSRSRITAFAIGSALCALGGSLLVYSTGYLTPESFTLWDSIYLLVAIVLGGRASRLGCLLGALIVRGVPYLTSNLASLPDIILGALLAITLLLSPNGVASLVRQPGQRALDHVLRYLRTRNRGDAPVGMADAEWSRSSAP